MHPTAVADTHIPIFPTFAYRQQCCMPARLRTSSTDVHLKYNSSFNLLYVGHWPTSTHHNIFVVVEYFSERFDALPEICLFNLLLISRPFAYVDLYAVATSPVRSKFDYCNSLYLRLPKNQISFIRQLLQNSFARAVTGTPKTEHTRRFPTLDKNRRTNPSQNHKITTKSLAI